MLTKLQKNVSLSYLDRISLGKMRKHRSCLKFVKFPLQ